jgi:hypothetical protein
VFRPRLLRALLLGQEEKKPEAVSIKTIRPIPYMARRYAERMAEFMGVPVEEIYKSRPFLNYLAKLTEI